MNRLEQAVVSRETRASVSETGRTSTEMRGELCQMNYIRCHNFGQKLRATKDEQTRSFIYLLLLVTNLGSTKAYPVLKALTNCVVWKRVFLFSRLPFSCFLLCKEADLTKCRFYEAKFKIRNHK
jgi:hypothetical protein